MVRRRVLSAAKVSSMTCLKRFPVRISTTRPYMRVHTLISPSVVFSFWTSTLDLVQQILDVNEITYTRIDGKMSLAKRTEYMRLFQTDDTVRVILVSITCGGAGLDLTAASRAYLLEPQWNPMIEEQALCRVHRVGQQRKVTTIRYLMRGSFEEVSSCSHDTMTASSQDNQS
ncbi:hypothetical protein N431DRAFT_541839 [Stipitochalara longipes BDJ]|nr:hypothetical protein N431DRAFT_541839 [Stipitochalara longipes BDJ]